MSRNLFADDRTALTFDDVLIVPRYSNVKSRGECDISSMGLRVPVVSANMDTITGLQMAKEMHRLGGLGITHRYMDVDSQLSLVKQQRNRGPIYVAVGSIHNDRERIVALIKQNIVDGLCVDIAHGHSRHMKDTLTAIRDMGFEGVVIAGNVCTPEGVDHLQQWGAEVVKVGVGGGSVCSTRTQTGCGFPQLQAIIDCAQVGVPIIADGGLRTPGDVAKAFVAGATAVMVGGMLAGTDCTPGWSEDGGTVFRGMASPEARKNFGQSDNHAEGVERTLRCKPPGSTERVIRGIAQGLQSAMSYVGAHNMAEFRENAQFVRVTNAVQAENVPHFRG